MKDESNNSSSSSFVVSVTIDDPHPDGSAGLTSATIALTYDPTVLSIYPDDITLGSIPAQGTGWQLSSVIDAAKGQIVIQIYSATPIGTAQPGSLVNIVFNVVPGALQTTTAVRLVDSATPNGQYFSTVLADSLSAMILSPGEDRLTIQTGVNPFAPVKEIAPLSKDSSLPSENAKAWPGLRYTETPDQNITDKYMANDSLGQPMEPPIDGPPILVAHQSFLNPLMNETLPGQPATDLFFKILADETDDLETEELYKPNKTSPKAALDNVFTIFGDQDWGICD